MSTLLTMHIFFHTSKEAAYRKGYLFEKDFSKNVDEYIHFYNEARPHATLAYKSPIRIEELYGE